MKKLFGFIILISILLSCVEVETVSPIPEIKYISFDYDYIYSEALDQTVLARVLEFSYIDGDADLGVYDEVNSDTTGYYPFEAKYGIFINFFEKVDTNYVERYFVEENQIPVDTIFTIDTIFVDSTKFSIDSTIKEIIYDTEYDTLYLNQLFPYDQKLDRVGQNKTVKGIVRVGILFPTELPYDTMRLEFYIRDRALHKSNVEVTDDFTNEQAVDPFAGS